MGSGKNTREGISAKLVLTPTQEVFSGTTMLTPTEAGGILRFLLESETPAFDVWVRFLIVVLCVCQLKDGSFLYSDEVGLRVRQFEAGEVAGGGC